MNASLPVLHEKFLSILPKIELQARVAFRRFPRHQREDCTAEVVAHAWASFLRLVRRGKDPMTFPTVLAKYSVSSVKAGKLIGCRCNRRDLGSPYRKKLDGFRIFSIDSDRECCPFAWTEILVETKHATPAETAAARIDFARWLQLQSHRSRRIAESLAQGHRTQDVARRFNVSPGRISQMREEFRRSWNDFHGDDQDGQQVELAVA